MRSARTTDTATWWRRRLRVKRAEKGRADVLTRHRARDWRGTRPTRQRWSGNGSRAADWVGEKGSPGPDWTSRPAPRPAARSALARWRHAVLTIGGVRGGGGRDSRWDFGPRVELSATARELSHAAARVSISIFFSLLRVTAPTRQSHRARSYFKTAIAAPPRPFYTRTHIIYRYKTYCASF